jgi:hypothetical protein
MKLLVTLSIFFAAQVSFSANYRDLSSKDPLAKAADHFNTEWSDGNITSGTSLIGSLIWDKSALSNKIAMEKTALDQVKHWVIERGGDDAADPQHLTQVKIVTKKFSDQSVVMVTKAYMIANAADDVSDLDKTAMGQIYALLNKLDETRKNLIVTSVTSVYKIEEDDYSRKVELHTFTNKKTGKAITFYTVEGTM